MPNATIPADPSPVDLYVARIERDHSGVPLTMYVLRANLPREIRMQVLEHVRTLHPNVTVTMIGNEIAAWSFDHSSLPQHLL